MCCQPAHRRLIIPEHSPANWTGRKRVPRHKNSPHDFSHYFPHSSISMAALRFNQKFICRAPISTGLLAYSVWARRLVNP